jgi:hypothetical protein
MGYRLVLVKKLSASQLYNALQLFPPRQFTRIGIKLRAFTGAALSFSNLQAQFPYRHHGAFLENFLQGGESKRNRPTDQVVYQSQSLFL